MALALLTPPEVLAIVGPSIITRNAEEFRDHVDEHQNLDALHPLTGLDASETISISTVLFL